MIPNKWLESSDARQPNPLPLQFLLRFALATFVVVAVTVGLATCFR